MKTVTNGLADAGGSVGVGVIGSVPETTVTDVIVEVKVWPFEV